MADPRNITLNDAQAIKAALVAAAASWVGGPQELAEGLIGAFEAVNAAAGAEARPQAGPAVAEDRALIRALGGPSKVAKQLGISAQRVQNWRSRGIPPEIKLAHPDLFLPHLVERKAARPMKAEA